MSVIRIFVTLLLLGAASGVSVQGQGPETPPAPPAPTAPPATPTPPTAPQPEAGDGSSGDFDRVTYSRAVVRLGSPYVLGPDGSVREAVVLMSDATIEGRVHGSVVVVLGSLRLGSRAVVDGSVVVVGGVATVDEGATVDDDFVIVGGSVDAPAGFMPGGEHVVIGPPGLGEAMRNVAPWFTRGLLWGRVIVPDLPWVWSIVGIVLLMNVALVLAFPGAIHAAVETLRARPFGTFFTGLLTQLLFAPVVTILAVSVVGIVVIPFLVCAMVVGWILGKAAVARWIGAGIVAEDEPDNRGQALRSLAIGFVLICLAYMVPVVGLAAWAMVGVFGLGAATLTLVASLKRERPAVPPPVAPSGESLPTTPAGTPALAVSEFGAFAPLVDAGATPLASEPPPAPPVPPAPPAAAVAGADLTAFPRATFLDRLAAAALDVLLVAIAYNLLNWWHDGGVFFVLLLGYHIAFWTWKGTTVGGIICSLRLVRTDGAPVGPSDALVRGLTSLFSLAALGLGFLWILRDPERQAWHDRIAGTYVVSVPRNWPLP